MPSLGPDSPRSDLQPARPATTREPVLDTKARLLDAAEAVFSERGFEGTSMRAVTQLAGVSVSAANYHFGSKEALLLSALIRRLGPLNERRLQRLDALEAAAEAAPVAAADLMDAFLRPTFEALQHPSDGGVSYRLLAARLYTDPHEQIGALKTELFGPVAERFVDALSAGLENLPREELLLGFHFVVGVMVHAVSGHCQQGLLDEGTQPIFSDADTLERMVAFATAGLHSIAASGAAGAPDHSGGVG